MVNSVDRYRGGNRNSFFPMDPFGQIMGRRGFLNDFFGTGLSGLSDAWESDFGVKVVDTDEGKKYQFGLPGVPKQDISIDVSGNVLTVQFEKKDENSNQVYSSRVSLGPDMDISKATAESDNGLLTINIPYVEKKSFKIEIEGSEDTSDNSLKITDSDMEELTKTTPIDNMPSEEKKPEAVRT